MKARILFMIATLVWSLIGATTVAMASPELPDYLNTTGLRGFQGTKYYKDYLYPNNHINDIEHPWTLLGFDINKVDNNMQLKIYSEYPKGGYTGSLSAGDSDIFLGTKNKWQYGIIMQSDSPDYGQLVEVKGYKTAKDLWVSRSFIYAGEYYNPINDYKPEDTRVIITDYKPLGINVNPSYALLNNITTKEADPRHFDKLYQIDLQIPTNILGNKYDLMISQGTCANAFQVEQLSTTPKLYGLFVGVRYYDSQGAPLFLADIGATIASKKLSNIAEEGNIEYLPLDSKHSDNKDKVKNKIDEIKNKMQSGDTFVLYLGGHGDTYKPEESGPETTASANNEFYALTNEIKDSISDNELYSYLKGENTNGVKMDSINKWIIIDACHSGGFWGDNNPKDEGDLEKLKNVALLTSVAEDKNGLFWHHGYGLYTYGLIEALGKDNNGYLNADLNENGTLLFSELYKYMYEKFPETEAFKNFVGKILYEQEFGDEVLFTADMWDPQFFKTEDFLDSGIQVVPVPTTALLFGPFIIGFVVYNRISRRRLIKK